MHRRVGSVTAGASAAFLVAGVLAGCTSGGQHASGYAGTIQPGGGSVSGLGGRVRITASKGAVPRAVQVSLTQVAPLALPAGAFRLDPHAHPLLTVHVGEAGGTIARYHSTVTMKLPAALPAQAARDVYLAVYEPRLQAFVHLPSTVDLRQRTVTAVAPHYSLTTEIVDTVKNVGVEAVKAADIVSLGPFGYIPAVRNYVEGLQARIVDNLFAIPPKLSCKPASKDQAIEQDATGGVLLKVCAEDIPSEAGYVRLRIRNGYAFPLLLWPGSSGIGVGFNDLADNASLTDFVRHIFWMQFNKEDAIGANIAQLTVAPSVPLPMRFPGTLDWGAVAVDVAMTVALDLLLPESKADEPALKGLMAAVREAVGSAVGKDAYDAAQQELQQLASKGVTAENIGTVLSIAGCAEEEFAAVAQNSSTNEKLQKVFEATANCVRSQIAGLGGDVTEMINGIADDLKVVPAGLEAAVAEHLQQDGINATTVTLGLNPAIPPCTPAVLAKALPAGLPPGTVLTGYACQGGYAIADLQPPAADEAFVVFSPADGGWHAIYGPDHWYVPCLDTPGCATLPMPWPQLEALFNAKKRTSYKIHR